MVSEATTHNYRAILRNDFGEQWGEQQTPETDQRKGLPAPPAQKPYPEDATLIDLAPPRQLAFGRMGLAQAIGQRRSRRAYTLEPMSLDELSFLLWATQGVQKTLKRGLGLRTVPAGGARHPFETYLSVHRVAGLEPGLYRYLPMEHKLCVLHLEPQIVERANHACGGNRFVRKSAVLFAWTAIPYRRQWLYGPLSGVRGSLIEAGHVCQNLYLACEAIGAGACAIGGYYQRRLDALLEVDGEEEISVYTAAVGKVNQGRPLDWTGEIDRIVREGDITRMWVRSYSWWSCDVFVVAFAAGEVSDYAEGDYVAIKGELVAVCSEYEGWPLVKGTAIAREKDPDEVSPVGEDF